ncbi:MAG: class I SAM-dependent methyltransferase [Verrucomicrobia bacterium]|nr:class I SAM-dependent methyltransferase [Verrucomicrobiota bacterium]
MKDLMNPAHDVQTTDAATTDAAFEHRTRDKWREVPSTRSGRAFSANLLEWPDDALLEYWEGCRREVSVPEIRGWFQDLYAPEFEGKDVLEVGPGIGIDGIFFAQHGARLTFADIVEENLALVRRLCALKGVEARTTFIEDFFHYEFDTPFDAFMFIGSMHHAPFEFSRRQAAALTPFLRPGGRVVMLAYPKVRYELSGATSFEEFAKKTDGERTPWAEWYDDEKTGRLFGPGFRLNWSRCFGRKPTDFIWFDLTKVDAKDCKGEKAS